jgi:hypothetical protein
MPHRFTCKGAGSLNTQTLSLASISAYPSAFLCLFLSSAIKPVWSNGRLRISGETSRSQKNQHNAITSSKSNRREHKPATGRITSQSLRPLVHHLLAASPVGPAKNKLVSKPFAGIRRNFCVIFTRIAGLEFSATDRTHAGGVWPEGGVGGRDAIPSTLMAIVVPISAIAKIASAFRKWTYASAVLRACLESQPEGLIFQS